MRLLIQHATVQYGAETILSDISFEIRDREKVAVVGRNGCGKTTLLKLIHGDVEAGNADGDEKYRYILAGHQEIGLLRQVSFQDGSVSVEDEIKKAFAPVYEIRRRMSEVEALLEQGKYTADGKDLLGEYADLQKRFDAAHGDSCEREMLIMFQKFGFPQEDLKRPIGSFSGGQQTKVAFMKLLLSRPDIMLLDEPTNHLDLPAIEWLEGYLKSYDKAVVIVSHDREFLDRISDVTYEIEYHRIKKYPGNYSNFLRLKEEALAKQEKDYEAQQKEIKRLTEWVEQWKNTPTKVSAARSKLKQIEHMQLVERPQRFDTTTFRAHFEPRITSYSEVIETRNLEIGYDHPLSRVDMKLLKGQRLAVIGENGKGKSTLLKTLMEMIPPLGGSCRIGKNVEIGYYDQQMVAFQDSDPGQTILENFWESYPKLTNEQVRSTLGAFAFSGEEVEKEMGVLSGGEKVRLALCKMFYTRPNLLILDEPTNHLDILGKESLEKMLAAYSGTVLFVSHDRYFIRKIATGILEFAEDGVYQYDVPYEEFLAERARAEHRRAAQDAAGAQIPGKGTGKNDAAGGMDASQTAAPMAAAAQNKDANGPRGCSPDKTVIKNPGKIRSKLERQLKKTEEAISVSEELAADLQNQLADPALSSDYQKLMDLQSRLEAEESHQEELLEQLMELEEQLAEFES